MCICKAFFNKVFVCHAILASVFVAKGVSYVIMYLFNDIHDQRAPHASKYVDTFAIGFGIRLDRPVGPRKEPDHWKTIPLPRSIKVT